MQTTNLHFFVDCVANTIFLQNKTNQTYKEKCTVVKMVRLKTSGLIFH